VKGDDQWRTKSPDDGNPFCAECARSSGIGVIRWRNDVKETRRSLQGISLSTTELWTTLGVRTCERSAVPLRSASCLVAGMVVMEAPDGSTREYQLHSGPQGLRLVGRCASYDLATMMREVGWQIVEVRSKAARRLLAKAGLLSVAVPVLPRRWSVNPVGHEWSAVAPRVNDSVDSIASVSLGPRPR
jgi:hypothetical protein